MSPKGVLKNMDNIFCKLFFNYELIINNQFKNNKYMCISFCDRTLIILFLKFEKYETSK